MSYRLNGGEYALDTNGKPIEIEYIEAMLQKVMLSLICERGKFYPNKDFGSLLKGLNKEPFEEYAAACIRQAVEVLDGVYLKSVAKIENGLSIVLLINEAEEEVIFPINENV